jgi:hypothetical protein
MVNGAKTGRDRYAINTFAIIIKDVTTPKRTKSHALVKSVVCQTFVNETELNQR